MGALHVLGVIGCAVTAVLLAVFGLLLVLMGDSESGIAFMALGAIFAVAAYPVLQTEHRPIDGIAMVQVQGTPGADPNDMATWEAAALKALGIKKPPFRFGFVQWFGSVDQVDFRSLVGPGDVIFVADGVCDLQLVTRTRQDDPQHQEPMPRT